MHAYTHARMHACIHTYPDTSIHICAYPYLSIHTRLHTYPHILTHTHIHPYPPMSCLPMSTFSIQPTHTSHHITSYHITSHHVTSHHITLRDNALVTYMELKETSGIKVCWGSWVFELRYLELLLWLAHVGPSTGALGSRDGLDLLLCWYYRVEMQCGGWESQSLTWKKQFFPHPKISHKPWVGDSKTWPRPQGASHNTVAVPASAHHSWAGTAPSAAPSMNGWKMKGNNNKKRKPWQYHAINSWNSMDFLHHFTVFQIPCWSMLNLG